MKISEYFNPNQHLVFHQDKDGNMIGGGYQLNNLMHHNKCPLFVSLDDRMTTGGGQSGGGGRSDEMENPHFIPEKFSDLFRDLAVPAGLFMMPAMFKPRNYAFEVAERVADADAPDNGNLNGIMDHNAADDDTDTDTDGDDDDNGRHTKSVPNDIFDTLLALVAPRERIQHDVKTRRHRAGETDKESDKEPEKKKNNKKKTRRTTRS